MYTKTDTPESGPIVLHLFLPTTCNYHYSSVRSYQSLARKITDQPVSQQVYTKTDTRRKVGRILLKGDNITLIQQAKLD